MELTAIFSIIILILSVIIHEISHGYMALYLGDSTAKYEGRLTLNPAKHIDPIGSIVVPLVTGIASNWQITFGWAKPVPFNPYNLRNRRWGEALVAAAGPASNIALAVIFSIIFRFMISSGGSATGLSIVGSIVLINIALAIFNLIPIPPLDGSKILFAFFPKSWIAIRQQLEKYQLALLLIYVFFVWRFLSPAIYGIFSLLTGIPF